MHDDIWVEWDAEAGVWFIEDSPVSELVGEAPTLDAMMTLLQVRVPEMLAENDCTAIKTLRCLYENDRPVR